MKRAFDCIVAGVLLVVASPVIATFAVLIRLTSRGPAIFIQDRVGREGGIFRCYKLRTMIVGTANVPTHLATSAHVTVVGRFLRQSKFDELPQLWNVFKGEMSLVGPRPCLPTQTRLIEEREQRGVLSIRPGLTGLAQIRGVDMSDPALLAEIDAEYLQNHSFLRDLTILFRTVFSSSGVEG